MSQPNYVSIEIEIDGERYRATAITGTKHGMMWSSLERAIGSGWRSVPPEALDEPVKTKLWEAIDAKIEATKQNRGTVEPPTHEGE